MTETVNLEREGAGTNPRHPIERRISTLACRRIEPDPIPCERIHRKRPNGFTLVELLIVLAMLALLAGLTIPRLFGVISRGRLQQAAQQLAHDLGTARLLAIHYGCPYEVRLEAGGTHYSIRPPYTPHPDSVTDGRGREESSPKASQIPSTSAEFNHAASAVNGDAVVPNASGLSAPQRQRPLPEFLDDQLTGGVRFGDRSLATQPNQAPITLSSAAVPARGIPANEVSMDEDRSLIDPASDLRSEGSNWVRSLAFYPDGRAEQHSIKLSDEIGRSIQLNVRGITGGVTIGPITRPSQSHGDDRNDEMATRAENASIAEPKNETR